MKRCISAAIMVFSILTLTTTPGNALPTYGTNCAGCHVSPTVENFVLPATFASLTVPITAFEATDTDSVKASKAGVNGYMVTESSTRPTASSSGWSSTSPASYTFSSHGTKTLYAWVKDLIGNVSTAPVAAVVDIELNNVPIADAGPDQNTAIGETVALDGTASSDLNLDPLTFQWRLTSVPAGSGAALSDPASPIPTFVADLAGEYVVELVVNDGTVDSTPDTARITTENTPPVALIQALIGDRVVLDGSGSSDADGNPLTFQWRLASVPVGSEAVLSDPANPNPTFVADVSGDYVVELVVNDGTVDSPKATMTISRENMPPVAVINLDQPAFTGDTINLDGSGSSDADGDPLTYQWSLAGVPAGSHAALSDPAAVNPNFVADVAGEYIVNLYVNDGVQSSQLDSVTLNVSFANEPVATGPPAPGAEEPTGTPTAPPEEEPAVSGGGDATGEAIHSREHEEEDRERTDRRKNRHRRRNQRRQYENDDARSSGEQVGYRRRESRNDD